MSGLFLGAAYGVQQGLNRLSKLNSPLGYELGKLDEMKGKYRQSRREGGVSTELEAIIGEDTVNQASDLDSTKQAFINHFVEVFQSRSSRLGK